MNRRSFTQTLGAAGLLHALSLPAALRNAATAPPLSCMLWTLTRQMPFERALETVAAAGYNGVELVGEFHKWSPAETQANSKRLAELKLVVDASSGVATGFAEPDQTDLLVRQLTEQMQWMQQLGCTRIILLSGKRATAIAPEQQFQVAADNLKRASDLAAEHRVQLLIEPIDRLENPSIYMASVAQGFDLVHAVGRPNVQVLFDLYHEQRGFGNLIEQLTNNITSVGLIHIADVPGRHDPGSGEIAYRNVYRKLAELQYDRYIAMEFYPLGEPVAALRQARAEVLTAYT